MIPVACLTGLYRHYLINTDSATPLDTLVDTFLNESTIDKECCEKVLSMDYADLPRGIATAISPWELVERWRELLSLVLIVRETETLATFRHHLIHRASKLSKCALWKEFQLLEAYSRLVGLLLDQPLRDAVEEGKSEMPISQLQSGVCPLEYGAHWSWGDIPHPQFHAELGALWALYAAVKGDERIKVASEKLGTWQLNTLDWEFQPFAGLYSQEGDSSDLSLLMSNYVLFDALGRLCQKGDFTYVAEQQLDRLSVLMSLPPGPIPIHALVIKAWFEKNVQAPAANPWQLTTQIRDPLMALSGYRSSECSAVATLYGGNTGMGAFHRGEVQLVNFGPQHLPLGDCRGFGLEGAGRLLATRVKTVSTFESGFALEGVARMASRPKGVQSPAGYHHGDPSGCWIDTALEMNQGHMKIEAQFNGIFEDKSFAFVFFVKALGCMVDGRQAIKPRSFQHYQGEICPVHFKGETSILGIEAAKRSGEMRVIPLGGGQNFWGADYLIAYQCHTELGPYIWHIV